MAQWLPAGAPVATGGDALPDSRRGLTVLIAALTALPALAIDMGLPALPALAAELGVGAAAAQLSIGLFLAGFALAQLACGPLADRFGRRPVLLGGLALFALAGLGCAAAPALPALLACRVLQGIGACTGTVLARAIIRDLFTGDAAAIRLSQAAAMMALAPIAAPGIGALLLAALGWRAIFLVLGLSGMALLLAVLLRLPETLPAQDRAVLAPRSLARGVAGFCRCRGARWNALAAACLFGGMFAYIAASPFALMAALDLGPGGYAGLFALTAGGILAGSLAAPGLLRLAGRGRAMLGGLVLGAAAGMALLLLAGLQQAGLTAIVVSVTFYTFARGVVVPLATAAALEPMRHAAGLASGLLGALQMGAAALAVLAAGLAGDPLLGMGMVLALSGTSALAFGLLARRGQILAVGGGESDRPDRRAPAWAAKHPTPPRGR